jgi:hypothetical protein
VALNVTGGPGTARVATVEDLLAIANQSPWSEDTLYNPRSALADTSIREHRSGQHSSLRDPGRRLRPLRHAFQVDCDCRLRSSLCTRFRGNYNSCL